MKGIVNIHSFEKKFGKRNTLVNFKLNEGYDDVFVCVNVNDDIADIKSEIASHRVHVLNVESIIEQAKNAGLGDTDIPCEYIHGINAPETIVDCDM